MQLTDTSALNPPIASSHGEIAFPENGFASENVLHFLHLDLAFSTNCFTPDKLSTIFFSSNFFKFRNHSDDTRAYSKDIGIELEEPEKLKISLK